jgi:predicted transcriptional regulator
MQKKQIISQPLKFKTKTNIHRLFIKTVINYRAFKNIVKPLKRAVFFIFLKFKKQDFFKIIKYKKKDLNI